MCWRGYGLNRSSGLYGEVATGMMKHEGVSEEHWKSAPSGGTLPAELARWRRGRTQPQGKPRGEAVRESYR